MAKVLATKTQTITTELSVDSFTVNVPQGQPAFVRAQFIEVDKDGDGNVVATRDAGAIEIGQARLLELLPGYNLPDFATTYAGIRDMLHAERDAQKGA